MGASERACAYGVLGFDRRREEGGRARGDRQRTTEREVRTDGLDRREAERQKGRLPLET